MLVTFILPALAFTLSQDFEDMVGRLHRDLTESFVQAHMLETYAWVCEFASIPEVLDEKAAALLMKSITTGCFSPFHAYHDWNFGGTCVPPN